MDAPAHLGCLLEVRVIGIITAEQTDDGKTEANDRLMGVAVRSSDHEDLESINDVNKTLLDHVEEFSSPITNSAARSSQLQAPVARRRRSVF